MLAGNQVTTKYKALRLKGLFPLGLSTLRINYTSFLVEMPLTKIFAKKRTKTKNRNFKKILRFLETFFFSEVFTNLVNRKKMKQFVGGKMPLFEK